MRIIKGAIVAGAANGYLGVQVAEIAYGDDVEYVEAPDEWFIRLKDRRPAVGREDGFLFLTRIGWEANKEQMRQAFETAQFKRGTWEDFEKHVEDFFTDSKKRAARFVRLMKKKTRQAEATLEKM